MFGATVTNDGKYVLIGARKDTNHINLLYYVDLTLDENKEIKGLFKPTALVDDWIGEFAYLQNHGSNFFFKSNFEASKSKVIKIDLASPDKANWCDVIPQAEGVLDAARCCNDKIVTAYIENASEKLRVFDLNSPANMLNEIKFPDIGSVMGWTGKHDSNELFYKFSSFSDPGSIYRVNIDTFETELIIETKLAGGVNTKEFKTDQVWYESKDGTKVPMFVVRKKSVLPDVNVAPAAPIPTLLYGYGGFNISLTPFFGVSRLVLLNNLDGMFCLANLRGGGEFGEDWHHAGTKEKKQNVFDDFIAAAEYLQKQGLTDNKHLAI